MRRFTYTAKNPQGEIARGTIEAKDILSARASLRELQIDASDLREEETHVHNAADIAYWPLLLTLRLYAGWLLAVLVPLYALAGSLKLHGGALPALVDSWLESHALLQIAFASFLFLLLSSLHRLVRGGIWTGIGMTILGFVLFVLFRINIV